MDFNDSKLTPKQIMFCQEYMVDLNATQAAIRAGYSEDTAKQIGSENLSKPALKAKIQEYMDLRSKRIEITADRVLSELSKIGFADIRKIVTGNALIDISDLDDDIACAISSVELVTRPTGEKDEDGRPIIDRVHKIRLNDKKGALELMGKHLKLYTEKTEHTGADGGAIEHDHYWQVEFINPSDAPPSN